MNILFLSQVIPYPISGGESIRSFNLLQCLSGIGMKVTAITPMSERTIEAEELLPGVKFITFHFPDVEFGPLKQITGYFKRNKDLVQLICSIICQEEINLAFIDYFFLGQYIHLFHSYGIQVIYGTHNSQARLRIEQPAKGINERIIRWFAFTVQWLHERIYFRKAEFLIVVSDKDRHYHNRFIKSDKIAQVPNFLDELKYIGSEKKENYAIITGNFNSFQNIHGLEWFLTEVWNANLDHKMQLLLAGNGSDTILNRITYRQHYSGIRAIGYVEDIIPFIAKAKVAIVPLIYGSGTRFKILEAMALRTQVVSTTKGAEGIAHDGTILIADDASSFRDCIENVMVGKIDNTEKEYQIFHEEYSLEKNKKRIQDILISCSQNNRWRKKGLQLPEK